MTLGIDYSSGPPTGRQVADAGYSFVARYLSYSAWKNITAAEYADMLANGIAVVLVWETTAKRMLGGYDAGVDDARMADEMAAKVGHPDGGVLYFACDFDATPAQQTAINAYLDGAASVIGRARVGMYGGYWPLSRALDAAKTTYAWQTLAWSGNNVDDRAHLIQRIGYVHVGGVDCDVDEAQHDDYGQHPRPNEEDDMEWHDLFPVSDWAVKAGIANEGDQHWAITYLINSWEHADQANRRTKQLLDQQATVLAQVQGLTAAVAAKQGIDPDELRQIVNDAVAGHVQITGTVEITGDDA